MGNAFFAFRMTWPAVCQLDGLSTLSMWSGFSRYAHITGLPIPMDVFTVGAVSVPLPLAGFTTYNLGVFDTHLPLGCSWLSGCRCYRFHPLGVRCTEISRCVLPLYSFLDPGPAYMSVDE